MKRLTFIPAHLAFALVLGCSPSDANFDDSGSSLQQLPTVNLSSAQRSTGGSVTPVQQPSKQTRKKEARSLRRLDLAGETTLRKSFVRHPKVLLELDSVVLPRLDLHRLGRNDLVTVWLNAAENLEAFQIRIGTQEFAGLRHETGFFDETGVSFSGPIWARPIAASKITSVFGMRLHPLKSRKLPHQGVDYAAPEGTPVFAVADGVVIRALDSRSAGKTVLLSHAGRYTSRYLHLSKRAKNIVPNGRVKRGDVVGYVGKTGKVTGPHLHFELLFDGDQIDPFTWRLPSSSALPPSQQAAHVLRMRALME